MVLQKRQVTAEEEKNNVNKAIEEMDSKGKSMFSMKELEGDTFVGKVKTMGIVQLSNFNEEVTDHLQIFLETEFTDGDYELRYEWITKKLHSKKGKLCQAFKDLGFDIEKPGIEKQIIGKTFKWERKPIVWFKGADEKTITVPIKIVD